MGHFPSVRAGARRNWLSCQHEHAKSAFDGGIDPQGEGVFAVRPGL
jgi:hypothetical protein